MEYIRLKADKAIATYCRLREQPLWRLLSADHGPVIIALLQTHLLEGERSIPASAFHERIERDLEELRIHGKPFPQPAKSYVSNWLSEKWIVRRFPVGATEEVYELSVDAANAIRFLMNLAEPRAVATESRLTGVIQQLIRLTEETETEPRARIAALIAEREKIDKDIESIQKGKFTPLPDDRALERIREIINLAGELADDFRRVRDKFEVLNRDLRQQLVNNEGSRGEVLNDLFTGVDVISDSEEGRTFNAFWRLLTDSEQNTAMDAALEEVLSRKFSNNLTSQERRFLASITRVLLEEGTLVHQVLQQFARSLKNFVQSREYLEQKRLHQVLKEAQQTALAIKDEIRPNEQLQYELELTSSRLASFGQWVLRDPSIHTLTSLMTEGEVAPIDPERIGELISQSEIDFRTLRNNIVALLQEQPSVSIGEILISYPAEQGLGSIVGYIDLAIRYGIRFLEVHEIVSWLTQNSNVYQAKIPTFYFHKEQVDALERA